MLSIGTLLRMHLTEGHVGTALYDAAVTVAGFGPVVEAKQQSYVVDTGRRLPIRPEVEAQLFLIYPAGAERYREGIDLFDNLTKPGAKIGCLVFPRTEAGKPISGFFLATVF